MSGQGPEYDADLTQAHNGLLSSEQRHSVDAPESLDPIG